MEVATGTAGGWWYYTQGVSDDTFDQEKGNAYTESTLMLPIAFNVRYTLKRFDIGIGMGYTLFAEDEMFGVGNQDQTLNEFNIGNPVVSFLNTHILTSFALIQAGRYTLSPQAKLGIFNIYTTHPDKDNFGHKIFWEAGFTNEISFAKWRLLVYPYFNTMTIQPRNSIHEGERHKIYSLGIMFGTRWSLYNK